jgi:gluconolactonase
MNRWAWVAICGAALAGVGRGDLPDKIGKIERLDPRMDEVIPEDARIEVLCGGFEWTEGPAWNRKEGFLVFSDIPRNSVLKWSPREGKVTLFLRPSGYSGEGNYSGEPGSNGLLWGPDGRLILCQHGDRRVARLESDGRFTVLADRYQGKRFNSPNDLAMKSNGDLYFTDPPYGLPSQDDPSRELDFCGVYRLSRDGTVTLLTKEMTRPNGIAFSPDERTLYVAQSDPARAIWMAYDVRDDGLIENGRVFFDSTAWVREGRKGLPDGMKVDVEGRLFATGPGGVLIFSPEGDHLGTLATGEATANCAFGDDGSTLYVTADMYLCKVRTTTRGWRTAGSD